MGDSDEKIRAALPHASADFLRRNGLLPSASQALPVVPLPIAPSKPVPRPRQRRGHDESAMQQSLIKWFGLKHRELGVADPRLLMAFPLQGARTKANAARMKAEGMRAGTPDLFLAVVRKPIPFSACDQPPAGLWIELKTERGRTTDSQDEMHELLARSGYSVVVCRSLDAAILAITEYLTAP